MPEIVTEREMLRLTVDGRSIEARSGQTVLQVCRDAGISIPTLCDDPRLEPHGGCRLCIVEIEGMRGFPTSCTTLAADGMRVTTVSDLLRSQRRTLVELLLSDHKVDCLTCESNGRCDLQDLAYEFEVDTPRFIGERHEAPDTDDNPLIARDLAKCIMCARCIRICAEVQGCNVYGNVDRGFDTLPQTPFGVSLKDAGCEFCGQCVSTCPVGAITDKLVRFKGRPWELTHVETICGYCGVGCTIDFHVHRGRVVGASAPLDKGVNKGNLCAKGRYGWGFNDDPRRLTTPLIRKGAREGRVERGPDDQRLGEFEPATWDDAINLIALRLEEIVQEHGPDAVGGLASAKCTNEENYLFQKFIRTAIGTHNIDHCARL